MLEDTFRACPPDVLEYESFWSEWAASSPAYYHRGRVPTTLFLHLRSGIDSETDALDFVENFGFDRNFAVRFFPYLYREACLCWPFDKVCLPLGRLSGRMLVREEYRVALLIGLVGGYTTFSTFGMETFALLNDRQAWRALLNVAASVVLGMTAVWAGYRLAESWLGV